MHDTLIQAAQPNLIGRSIITVLPTTEQMERFPLDAEAVAYRYAEGAVTRLSGKKSSTVDIYTNILAEESEEWTKEFAEDATWNVMNNMVEIEVISVTSLTWSGLRCGLMAGTRLVIRRARMMMCFGVLRWRCMLHVRWRQSRTWRLCLEWQGGK